MKNNLKDICIIHINSTQNNTILTASNLDNQVISTKTMGLSTKKRGKRSVPNGALLTGESLGSLLVDKGYSLIQIRIKGFGSGRENAIQGLITSGLKVAEILDITQVPHNGCRPPKRRRI
jgi:small subunit ribosomal protein S11